MNSSTAWKDWIGIIASVGCAIHCAAMPLVIGFLPSLGLSFLADESCHMWMALVCFAIALMAFVPGWRRHRRLQPMMIGGCGVVLITGAAFGVSGNCCELCNDTALGHTPTRECTDSCCEPIAGNDNASVTQYSHVATEKLAAVECTECFDRNRNSSKSLADSAAEPVRLSVVQVDSESPVFQGWLWPWITPFGGMLLVSAHLLNRRWGCQCGCCSRVTHDALLS